MLIPFVITLEDGDFESLLTSSEIIELGSTRLILEGEGEFLQKPVGRRADLEHRTAALHDQRVAKQCPVRTFHLETSSHGDATAFHVCVEGH